MSRIFVGNLSFNTTEESIENYFSKIVKPESVKIIKDKATGMSKGFGFVEIPDEFEEKVISAFNLSVLDGRKIRVKKSVHDR